VTKNRCFGHLRQFAATVAGSAPPITNPKNRPPADAIVLANRFHQVSEHRLRARRMFRKGLIEPGNEATASFAGATERVSRDQGSGLLASPRRPRGRSSWGPGGHLAKAVRSSLSSDGARPRSGETSGSCGSGRKTLPHARCMRTSGWSRAMHTPRARRGIGRRFHRPSPVASDMRSRTRRVSPHLPGQGVDSQRCVVAEPSMNRITSREPRARFGC